MDGGLPYSPSPYPAWPPRMVGGLPTVGGLPSAAPDGRGFAQAINAIGELPFGHPGWTGVCR